MSLKILLCCAAWMCLGKAMVRVWQEGAGLQEISLGSAEQAPLKN